MTKLSKTAQKHGKTRQDSSWMIPGSDKPLSARRTISRPRKDDIFSSIPSGAVIGLSLLIIGICSLGAYQFILDKHFWLLPCGNGACGSTQTNGLPFAALIGLAAIYILSVKLMRNKITATWITGIAALAMLAIPLWLVFAITSYQF